LLQLTAGDKGSYLYAAFGALVAHEDDTERAVRAAMELRQPPPEQAFISAVQIGLSRGRVRAGAYGSQTRRSYGVIGAEVILACRLMEAGAPGEVWCSPTIHQALSKRWAFEALQPVKLKGKTEAQPVYRPLRRQRGRAISMQGALVGRRAELQTLTRLLIEAQAGQRRVLLLEGEAGIGKSRLVGELARLAEEQDVTWLEGAGRSIEQRTAYRAWRDVLATYFGIDAGLDRAERGRRVRERVTEAVGPELAERVPLLNDILRLDLPETDLTRGLGPKLRHQSLAALVVDLLRAATTDGPLVLALEDAHWLDSLSWELALSVARGLSSPAVPRQGRTSARAAPAEPATYGGRPIEGKRGGLLLLLALRPLEEAQQATYTALASLEGAETLRLEALPHDETVALAASCLSLTPATLPAEVAELVRERAGGNPFFAEELAYVLRDSGAVVIGAEDGVCTLTDDLDVLRERVPDTVEGVVLARIDRLPPEEQLVLKVAAVIGRGFLLRTLRDVHPQQVIEELLQAHLDDLAWRGLTPLEAREPELSYIFKHIITQQVAYDTLLFAQRRELHRTVAGWYERVYADDLSPYYALLTHHWNRVEDVERELHYARLAGKQAAAQFANAEAVSHLSRALDLTPADDLAGRYTLLLTREKVYDLQGAREAESRDLEALERLANALDDDGRRAETALRRSRYTEVMGDYPASIAAAQTAIDLARAAQDVKREALGYRAWGRALTRKGDYESARQRFEQALSLAKAAGAREVEAASLQTLGIVCYHQGNYGGARDYYERALCISRETGDRSLEGYVLSNLGLVFAEQGDHAKAREHYEQALRIGREIGDRLGEISAFNSLGLIASIQGDYAGARSLYDHSLRISRESGNRLYEGSVLANLGTISSVQGQYVAAMAYYEQSLRILVEIGYRQGEGEILSNMGLISHQLGDDKAALEYSQRALRIARELGDRHGQGHALTCQGHALAGLGYRSPLYPEPPAGLVASETAERLAEATDAYRQALDLRRELGQHNLATEPLAGLARVSLAQGNLVQAQAHVEGILSYLESNTLEGTDEPFRVYLTCHQVLQANQDPRAQNILDTAYALLQEQAAQFPDEETRRVYLENVPAHREIVAAYQSMQEARGENG
jgi:predicted ATPase